MVTSRGAASCRRPDRKSTRLNSSHQLISYAVFCLKKRPVEQDRSTNAPTILIWAHLRPAPCPQERAPGPLAILIVGPLRLAAFGLYFFFLMEAPPPNSPLFPPADLFRA